MRTSKINANVLLLVLFLLVGCSGNEELLSLDRSYLHVADVLEYCQGSCDVPTDWEGKNILVKGHVPDVESEAAMDDAFARGRFFLHDIRNGMFIEIRTTGQKDAIFQKLSGFSRLNEVFVSGMAESVIVNEGDECRKGLVVVIASPQEINVNQ